MTLNMGHKDENDQNKKLKDKGKNCSSSLSLCTTAINDTQNIISGRSNIFHVFYSFAQSVLMINWLLVPGGDMHHQCNMDE